jgi:hypothetical protein
MPCCAFLSSVDQALPSISSLHSSWVVGTTVHPNAVLAWLHFLQEKAAEGGEPTTLEDLSAYLILQRAEESLGFDASQYGLTDGQAGDIAITFARYDANDDFRLELSELRKLRCMGRQILHGVMNVSGFCGAVLHPGARQTDGWMPINRFGGNVVRNFACLFVEPKMRGSSCSCLIVIGAPLCLCLPWMLRMHFVCASVGACAAKTTCST